MLRSALFPKVTAGDPQPLVDEARRLVKQRLARPRQVEALRREILSATGASISAEVLTGFVGQADGRRPRNRNDRRTLLDWANWAVDRPRCQVEQKKGLSITEECVLGVQECAGSVWTNGNQLEASPAAPSASPHSLR